MKKFNLFSIIVLITMLFSSCSSEKEATVKNKSTDIDGDLYGYLEVVDDSYKISLVGDDLILTVKLKAVKALEKNKKFSEIQAELLDESDMPIPGVEKFWLYTYYDSECQKINNILNKGIGETAVQLKYKGSSWDMKYEEVLKIVSKKAKSFSINVSKVEIIESEISSSSTEGDENEDEPVVKESSGENWDKVLADYESYTDKYIKLLKKANTGDMSAISEYADMLGQAQELQASLLEAENEMTPAQLQKFMKIQQKLINAASSF